jgi:hypothetical protein
MLCRRKNRLEGLQFRFAVCVKIKQKFYGLETYSSPHKMRDLVSHFLGSRSYAAFAVAFNDCGQLNRLSGLQARFFSSCNTKQHLSSLETCHSLHNMRDLGSRSYPAFPVALSPINSVVRLAGQNILLLVY